VERPRGDDVDDAPAHLDSDDGPTEPALQIFLGDGDPLGAYYASKSASHHIETENALLRWPGWRLSSGGIDALIRLITSTEGVESVTDWARLLIGISLVTGRRLPLAHVVLLKEGHPSDGRLTITLTDKVLHLPAARPDLKGHDDSTDPLPEFCAPWAATLRLPLPKSWYRLMDRLARSSSPKLVRIEREADRLLDGLPPELAITEKGIAHALRLALLEAGRDDLALVKLLTDAAEANTQNLIHYASYARSDVEDLWHQIVRGWAGPLGSAELPERVGERVGSPFGIEVDKVAEAVADLKGEFHRAVSEGGWKRAHTLLVLYLSLWLGLGTAGRGTRHPIPPLITDGGWALVQDKHRPDASTDRLVPLSEGLRAQIEVVRALTEAFGVVDPEFATAEPEANGGLPLRVFVGGEPTLFRPSHWNAAESIKALPRNWARRLVRSDSPELLGRFKDAGLGHWVRGRHPWSWTSTFPAQAFARDWLAVQSRLEAALGFDLLSVPPLVGVKTRLPAPRDWGVGGRAAEADSDQAASKLSDEAIQALLEACGRDGEYEAVFETEPPVPEAARWLLAKAVGERHRVLKAQKGRSVALPVADAEAIAAHIRTRTKIPIFASPPRSRFQRNWLVDGDAFSDLIRVEREVLPAIDKDLRSLPPPEEDHGFRIGRLIAAVAVRAGLLDTQHINALFVALAKGAGIEAVGEARVIEILARTKRDAMPVRRTVLLEPFLSVLLMTEGHLLVESERPTLDRMDRHRYTEWNQDFQRYLKGLGVRDTPTLPRFLAALRQKLMIESSPILAAYASGELFTVDLPISEFRRLAGLEVRPSSVTDDHLEGGRWHEEAKGDEDALPADLRMSSINLARKFSKRQSPYLSEWIRVTRDDLKGLKDPADVLLGRFALFLLESELGNQQGARNAKPRDAFKGELKSNLSIVWAGLAQVREQPGAINPFGPQTLRQLMGLTAEHFAARRHRTAWSRFHSFLHSEYAENVGISIAVGREVLKEYVSAKILSRDEMDKIEVLLGSVQSGIGTDVNRRAAQAHFALTRDFGARRSETEFLRLVDLDDELVRIREYEGRTLKTKASARILPLPLLATAIRSRIEERGRDGMVLDALAESKVSAANFYYPVSKAMKEATGDPDIGLHHLRHSKASLMLLRMLDNVVPMDRVATELPWLPSSLPSREEISVLLGSAGQAGQGMKAISALLGHLHETTTLHHYVHTLCIALHAHCLAQPRIDLVASFRRRLPMGSSLYRHQKALAASGVSGLALEYGIRDVIEGHPRWSREADLSETAKAKLLRKSSPAMDHDAADDGSDFKQEAIERVTQWERLHRYLVRGEGLPPEGTESARRGLLGLVAIPSGKKGVWTSRHPMPYAGFDGTPLPAMLLAGLQYRYATALTAWLIQLRRDHGSDFDWLMDRWRFSSNPVSGAIRLSKPGDHERAIALSRDKVVQIQISEIPDTASRRRSNAKPRYQMTIKLSLDAELRPESEERAVTRGRNAGAVRWVMTWASVLFEPKSASLNGSFRPGMAAS
jgi:integrase